jgi:hypothetical protein
LTLKPEDLILQELKEIKHLLTKNYTEINVASKAEYFEKTPWKYDNGVLYLYSELFSIWEPSSIKVQQEHEKWLKKVVTK